MIHSSVHFGIFYMKLRIVRIEGIRIVEGNITH